MPDKEIAELERSIQEQIEKLNNLRKKNQGGEVKNYSLRTLEGELTLLDFFGDKDQLLVIHNMGQGCRYCTLWADGINGILHHLESAMSVVLVSKDSPETQRRFASSRSWRFRLASHEGGEYIREQSVSEEHDNMPGAVLYEKEGDKIRRKNMCVFGPGDLYCAMWSFLGLAGQNEETWTPQYSYWTRPDQLDDGGKNLIE